MKVAANSPLFVHDFSMDHGMLLERWNVVALKAAPDRAATVTITVGYPEPGTDNEIGVSFDVDFSINQSSLLSIFRAMNSAYGAGKRNGENETVNQMRALLRMPPTGANKPVAFYTQAI